LPLYYEAKRKEGETRMLDVDAQLVEDGLFGTIQKAPADPILGLYESFIEDPREEKLNLAIGVYRDEHGKTPLLASVREAETRLLAAAAPKTYLGMAGLEALGPHIQRLIFGRDTTLIDSGRLETLQCPGGTGALRVAAEFFNQMHPNSRVWLPEPTWGNHKGIFERAGVSVCSYPYLEPESMTLDMPKLLKCLNCVSPGDVVLLHGCCHNPSGLDPDAKQWKLLAEMLATKKICVLFDLAYQGFAEGLEEDAMGLRQVAKLCPNVFVASSFSKSFALYSERLGALTVLTHDAEATEAVVSHLKLCIRRNYSNPPAHGARIVYSIFEDPSLRLTWEDELKAMRDRIREMRQMLVAGLDQADIQLTSSGNDHLLRQCGMFSYSGLGEQNVAQLRQKHGIYLLKSGRINVAALNQASIHIFVSALGQVLKN
jgi:aromatic-amino-acid transaminase